MMNEARKNVVKPLLDHKEWEKDIGLTFIAV